MWFAWSKKEWNTEEKEVLEEWEAKVNSPMHKEWYMNSLFDWERKYRKRQYLFKRKIYLFRYTHWFNIGSISLTIQCGNRVCQSSFTYIGTNKTFPTKTNTKKRGKKHVDSNEGLDLLWFVHQANTRKIGCPHSNMNSTANTSIYFYFASAFT